MKTKISIIDIQNKHTDISDAINSIAEVESRSKVVDNVMTITMKEQLSDDVINEILNKFPRGVIFVTKHFWHSTKQRNFQIIQAPSSIQINSCLIGEKRYGYTEYSSTSKYPSKWDDAIYLGYGTYQRNQ